MMQKVRWVCRRCTSVLVGCIGVATCSVHEVQREQNKMVGLVVASHTFRPHSLKSEVFYLYTSSAVSVQCSRLEKSSIPCVHNIVFALHVILFVQFILTVNHSTEIIGQQLVFETEIYCGITDRRHVRAS